MLKAFKTIAITGTLAVTLAACAAEPVQGPATGQPSPMESQAYNEAIQHFQKLRGQNPGEIEATLGLARNLRWSGRASEAARILEQDMPRFGTDGRFLAELGKVRLAQGMSTQGVGYLKDATQKITDDWRLFSALGIGLDYQRNYREAETAYLKALEMCPDDAAVMNNLGISRALSGRLDRAILTLEDALELEGHTGKIQRNLKIFRDARDLCPSCATDYLRQSGSMILAAGLRGTDSEGPCTPQPEYVQEATVMTEQLVEAPSINIKVYFEFDSAILKPEAREVLDNLGQALTSGELSDYRFEIAGHTDAVGTDAYNLDLSDQRARAVLDYLVVNFGIDARRIESVGYGESRLLDPEDPEGDVNRRVQVTRLGRMGE